MLLVDEQTFLCTAFCTHRRTVIVSVKISQKHSADKCSPFWTETNHKDFLKENVQILWESRSFMWNSWYLIKDPPPLLKDQQADVIAKPCRFLYAFRITLQWLYISLLSTISGVIFIFFFILLLFLVFFFGMPVFFSARTIWAFPPLFAF